MNKQRRQDQELLDLEIKLARLKIAAEHEKYRQAVEKERDFAVLPEAVGLLGGRVLQKTATLPISRKYRFGALVAWFVWEAFQGRLKK